ncbi:MULTISPECIES: DUF1345 domain-containing protein [unclassified Mesorhizobium]|uniref:DUF1345 domain-containing protein n=1 Tax=unclassified Mesorhizobium TaxID=325217 RepID=UPI000FCB86B2|nr:MULTISPECIES: DUF1345 domain-containing protein [unclassified Mesorhizobium]RUU62437.1 DUF1345 domain-containing protein [Mesorhizobium sp. M7A.T.Ca.TU.009.01.1.1]RUT81770.1 DUF1345 domain-containing protein [Mesorhizobium sp. M7A.T.Ca.US.000.02.2.1]RUT88577.1 DUF1345 domain-containing protein [Mesorhizobium sp. M7A.T.Ca.US.000.02.1.1]RUT96616.1 DUF1345 domain-containing protein [Mesorhizobium sp. M7A.T.Ca.TU.009.02.1.1]RWN47016.1 MAG: DUF1345 domain-containing protein [Mesorhizobium sp.]
MAAETPVKSPIQRHMLFAVSACVGVFALLVALLLHAPLAYSIGANSFFAAYVILVVAQMPKFTGRYLSRNARATDQPVLVIFAVTLVVVGVAVISLFLLINQKDRSHPVELTFALLSIPLGWFTIHAMAALHYAHVYWMDGDAVDAETRKKIPVGGLLFPGDKRPEGWDFLYFSTVIGMTAQTADTNISTTHMRRVVLVHSILSFFFNTVIVAAAVNLAVSLGGP